MSRLRDSKQLEPDERTDLAASIQRYGDWGIGAVSQQVIDQIGIAWATRLAMLMAVNRLRERPDALLIDGREFVHCDIEQHALVRADARCKSVAAASIVAKVARDRMMVELDSEFPGYGLARNKGYSSTEHLEALRRLGYSTVHRLTFAPVRAALSQRHATPAV